MTISESTSRKMLALAWWYERKPYNPYVLPGEDKAKFPDEIIDELSGQRLRYSLLAFKEIYNARRNGGLPPNSNSSEASDEPSEPKRKRQAVAAELPDALKRHWAILRVCNRSDDGDFFVRVKARALRALATIPQGIMKPSDRINAHLFSFLKAQELCALSECSTEWNYQTQNVPQIWEKLGRDFGLPDDYWPRGDYSKPRCVRNLDYIDFANQELRQYTEVGSPDVRTIGKWIGRSAPELRSDLADPQERFTQHTLPIMKDLLADDATLRFRELVLKRNFDDPRGLVNLFWTSGYPKKRRVFELMVEQFVGLRGRPESTKERAASWLDTMEWVVNRTPQWEDDMDRRWVEHPIHLLGRSSRTVPVDEHKRVLGLILKLMQKGGVGEEDLKTFLLSSLPLSLLKPITDAMRDKNQIYSCITHFWYRCFQWGGGFVKTNTPEELIQAFQIFKGPAGWNTDVLLQSSHDQPYWIYEAAKTRSPELMALLIEIGVKCEYQPADRWGGVARDSIAMALERRESLEVIKILRGAGVPTTDRAIGLIESYSNDPSVESELRVVLGLPPELF